MSLRRVGVLLGKELLRGPKNFIFVWAVVAPVAISLVVSLIFGTLFAKQPGLGIVDEGSSALVMKARETTAIVTQEYSSISDLRHAVESGRVEMGIVLPADFDASVRQGKKTTLTAFIWGESSAQDRTILGVTLVNLVRETTGRELPLEIESITLGGEVSPPWNERLLPFIVLMAVFLGGMFLPATSVINEKEKRTLTALLVTPTTPEDVFLAKGLVGIGLSLLSGVIILALNQAFGARPLLLVLVLALGAVMAAGLGLLLGVALKDVTSLFAVWKSGGILLFGPAFIYMFPQIPEWIGRIFPTYYVLQPVIEITQRGGGWEDIAINLLILVGLDLLLVVAVTLMLKRSKAVATLA
jgi:ABC-2 type transport system permease protein